MSAPVPNPPDTDQARWYSGQALWHKVRRVSRKAGTNLITAVLVLFHCLRDKDTPMWAKGVITGALGYFILPADLVPDLLPGAGYGDDWGAIVAAMATVAAYIKEEHRQRAACQIARFTKLGNFSDSAGMVE